MTTKNFPNKIRTANCLLVDDYRQYLLNVPFSHILLIDGLDKNLMLPSQSKWNLIENFQNLPKSKYFIGRVIGRRFIDIYKRPSYGVEVLDHRGRGEDYRTFFPEISKTTSKRLLNCQRPWY